MLVIHSPLDILWYQNLLDVVYLTIAVIAAVYSWRRYRYGRPEYAVLMVAAFVYGLLLELWGMVVHHSYTQGTFAVMLDWRWVPGFSDATLMPLYVPFFYPVMLFLGYKLVEALGIESLWQRAIVGGLIMSFLDAPYIIEGNLRHVVWWTWHQWDLYQLWLGWPLVDMWWQMTWDALIFYLLLRLLPRLTRRASVGGAQAHASVLIVAPVGIAVVVNLIGPFLHLPIVIATYVGGRQWPVVVVLYVVYLAVAVRALRSARPLRVETVTAVCAGIYVVAFVAMVIGNDVHEGRVPFYAVVQVIGLVMIGVTLVFPAVVASRRTDAAASQRGLLTG